MTRIDAHLHVFTKVSPEFPRETTPVCPAEREEPVEKLLAEMEQHQIAQGGARSDRRNEPGTASVSAALPARLPGNGF